MFDELGLLLEAELVLAALLVSKVKLLLLFEF